MKKLTAEKCREFISVFKSLEKEGHLALTSGYHLQALEIALPILEQQERGCQKCGGTGEMDSGGSQPWGEQILIQCDCKLEQNEPGEGDWIEWNGGKQPVPSSTPVEVKFRNGAMNTEEPAGWWRWECTPDNTRYWDIIAYRIIPEQPTNQNGEQ